MNRALSVAEPGVMAGDLPDVGGSADERPLSAGLGEPAEEAFTAGRSKRSLLRETGGLVTK